MTQPLTLNPESFMLVSSLLAAMALSGNWEEVKKCLPISDRAKRLACYDTAAGREETVPVGDPLPIENRENLGEYDPVVLRQALEMIKDRGWRCDSLTSMTLPSASGYQFTVTCNQFRYIYIFEDRGGRWQVSVQ